MDNYKIMDNDTILEVKDLLKNIDYLEINLSNQFLENNKQILTLKNNLNDINEVYHILCKKIF
jgi:hypothetical protein